MLEVGDKRKYGAGCANESLLIKVMEEDEGYIALTGANSSGDASVLIPAERSKIQVLAEELKLQRKRRSNLIVVVAEGDDAGRAKDIYDKLIPLMEGYELRYTILGHVHRGGKPSAYDRLLATRMGTYAVELFQACVTAVMIGADGDRLNTVSLPEAVINKAEPDPSKFICIKL